MYDFKLAANYIPPLTMLSAFPISYNINMSLCDWCKSGKYSCAI